MGSRYELAFHYNPADWQKIDHSTTVVINDESYQAFGSGNANDGLLANQLTHDGKLGFDPELLAIFMLAGQPIYSEFREGATNLFKPSALLGGLKYQRSYKFSNGSTWDSQHDISFDPEAKRSTCTFMTRNLPVHMFAGKRLHIQVLLPLKIFARRGHLSREDFPCKGLYADFFGKDTVETFIPAGPGLIQSIMCAEWKSDDGKDIQATIESTYWLNHHEKLPNLHFRHLKFAAEHTNSNVYRQVSPLNFFFSVKSIVLSRWDRLILS